MSEVTTRVLVSLREWANATPVTEREVVVTRPRGEQIAEIVIAAVPDLNDRAFDFQVCAAGEALDPTRTLEDYGVDDDTPLDVTVTTVPHRQHVGWEPAEGWRVAREEDIE